MFPRNYFGLFPPFPRENKVFVAMSFDEKFQSRWDNAIAPAIQRVEVNGDRLQPHRVDAGTIGDSILTEILGGVTNDRLIFSDITSLGNTGGKPIRSGNVMYEIGLAHSVRLPEEVLIFRSDTDPLLFDVANVRVNFYDPDGDPEDASQRVVDSIVESLRELDLKRNLAVKSAFGSLDYESWKVLSTAMELTEIKNLPTRNLREAFDNARYNSAIIRLLEIGALEAEMIKLTPELLKKANQPIEALVTYRLTEFGRAVFEYSWTQLSDIPPEVISEVEKLAKEEKQPLDKPSE